MVETPEFIVATRDNPEPRAIAFEQIYPQNSDITNLTLLWNNNSYHINVVDQYFIINGGRKQYVSPRLTRKMELECVRRNTMQVNLRDEKYNPMNHVSISYVVGLINGKDVLMLKISSDGTAWQWVTTR